MMIFFVFFKLFQIHLYIISLELNIMIYLVFIKEKVLIKERN